MKVAPVSGDLLVKLAIVVVVAGAGFWAVRKVQKGVSDQIDKGLASVGDWAGNAVNYINPASDQNLAYRSVNAFGGWLTGDQNWNLGGYIYDKVEEGRKNPTLPLVDPRDPPVYDYTPGIY